MPKKEIVLVVKLIPSLPLQVRYVILNTFKIKMMNIPKKINGSFIFNFPGHAIIIAVKTHITPSPRHEKPMKV